MRHAGFVLVGGHSSRMGRDKALLPWRRTTLAQHVAQAVQEAATSVALIGDPSSYSHLGYPVCADDTPGNGPAGGIATALAISEAEWSLIVGCDMPFITAEPLRMLLQEAAKTDRKCVVAAGPSGPEPLCAVYHRDCLGPLKKAIAESRLRMRDIVRELPTLLVTGIDPESFANLNTPEDFEAFTRAWTIPHSTI
ncbi:MAG: molybdenum cofactor guanylyltransferase [Bryobacteraceae bacterium]